jgi:hypothetical protein
VREREREHGNEILDVLKKCITLKSGQWEKDVGCALHIVSWHFTIAYVHNLR